jgi:hypothetical protein
MVIPEEQLETWAKQGAVTPAKATHESIRLALSHERSPIKDKITSGNVEVYLQGSYRNDTNIRGDSDVDVVVQLNSAFSYGIDALTQVEQQTFHQAHPGSATYGWSDFRREVIAALKTYYGAAAVDESGTKAVKVKAGSGRLSADVLVCLQHREFSFFWAPEVQSHVEGVAFYATDTGRRIVNFPKQHYDNGVAKNDGANTDGWFKPTVRMFKNARTHLVEQELLASDTAPSYFLQCLLYNVPGTCFGTSYQHTYYNVVKWLRSADVGAFVCQNGQLPLFGATPEQWSAEAAGTTAAALTHLWDTW